MYLINTSFHTMPDLYDEALKDVRDNYLTLVEKSGIFTQPLMTGILAHIDPDTRSFALQMRADDIDRAMIWLETEGATFFEGLTKKYGERLVYFTTPMEIL